MSERTRTIDKIKWDGKRMVIHYRVNRRADLPEDEHVLRCSDQPRPDFEQTLNALIPHVGQSLEINDHAFVYELQPTGISFTWSDHGLGAVVTCRRDLDDCNSPLILNTPYKAEDAEEGPCLPAPCVEALHAVIDEAIAYIDGHRAQLALYGHEDDDQDNTEQDDAA